MWWLGTILVILSWTAKVSYIIGWIGFTMACLSSLISVIKNKAWVPPPDGDDKD
jgi:hypothetical protein